MKLPRFRLLISESVSLTMCLGMADPVQSVILLCAVEGALGDLRFDCTVSWLGTTDKSIWHKCLHLHL